MLNLITTRLQIFVDLFCKTLIRTWIQYSDSKMNRHSFENSPLNMIFFFHCWNKSFQVDYWEWSSDLCKTSTHFSHFKLHVRVCLPVWVLQCLLLLFWHLGSFSILSELHAEMCVCVCVYVFTPKCIFAGKHTFSLHTARPKSTITVNFRCLRCSTTHCRYKKNHLSKKNKADHYTSYILRV